MLPLCKPHKLLWIFSELSSLFVRRHRSCYYDSVYRCTECTPWYIIMLIGSKLKSYYHSSPDTTTKECRLTWWISCVHHKVLLYYLTNRLSNTWAWAPEIMYWLTIQVNKFFSFKREHTYSWGHHIYVFFLLPQYDTKK